MEILLKDTEGIRLINIPDNELELIDWEILEHTFTQEEKDKINMWCKINEDFTITETSEYFEYKNSIIKQELNTLQQEMKALNSDRKDLQDLVDLWLEAPWDIEAIEQLTQVLQLKAQERKDILNK